MKIWIRSQDGRYMSATNKIGMSATRLSIVVDGLVYGTYESEERVIKVLDEIWYVLTRNSASDKRSCMYRLPKD